MSRRLQLPFLVLTWVVLIALGCSQASDPVVPDNPNDLTASRCVEFNGNRMLWGWWDVSIDSATGQVDIIPVRGPAFNANVMQFLHPPFSPTNMMEISILGSSNLPEGFVDVDVTFHHPFPGMNQFSGFDVKGIFMADGSQNGDHDPDIIYGDVDHNEAHMLNADGCTRWWNASEFMDPVPMFSFKPGKMGNDSHPTATLNPYKYYADDMPYDGDVAELDTSNRGVFTPDGPTHRRNYKIQFPVIGDVPSFMFSYAVDASWEPPDPMGAPDYDIEYFGPGAQCQEAYHLSANTIESDLWYEDGDSGGMIHLEVEVFDWQGASTISGVPGEVSAIWIESPIITSPVDILPQATAYPGSQSVVSVVIA